MIQAFAVFARHHLDLLLVQDDAIQVRVARLEGPIGLTIFLQHPVEEPRLPTSVVHDIGMVFFVGVITEEVLEAVMPGGALYRWRRTLLPVVAAIGGVLGATAMYFWYLQSTYEFMLLDGWPVAAALDVAFAYFIAKAIFPRRRGPVAFLLLLAIVSNTLGIVSIAIGFPAADAYPAAVVLMAPAVLLAAWLRSARIDRIWLYLVTSGTLSWFACYWGGIPPALALVPIVPFLPHRPRGLDLFAERPRRRRVVSNMCSGIPCRPCCCSLASSTGAWS